MVSSTGILLSIPLIASCAAMKAVATPEAFLFTQGTSTSPATGSHTSPSTFLKVIATALMHALGPALKSSHIAAADIAEAEPHSAWQPPSAPETLAIVATTIPTADAVNIASTISSSLNPCSSCMVIIAAGSIPQLPAVGVATILPIAALYSLTAKAYESPLVKIPPQIFTPFSLYL